MNAAVENPKDSSADSICLYVFSPSKHDRLYQVQMETLADRLLTLADHNLTVAEVFEHEEGHVGEEQLPCEKCHFLRQQFHITPGQFKVVLVTDASVKLCAESCVSCEEVLMRIDNQSVEARHVSY